MQNNVSQFPLYLVSFDRYLKRTEDPCLPEMPVFLKEGWKRMVEK